MKRILFILFILASVIGNAQLEPFAKNIKDKYSAEFTIIELRALRHSNPDDYINREVASLMYIGLSLDSAKNNNIEYNKKINILAKLLSLYASEQDQRYNIIIWNRDDIDVLAKFIATRTEWQLVF